MDAICAGKDYNDKFDVDCYVKNYRSKDSYIMKKGSAMDFLHTLFSNMEESDGRLLEFGCGPCIFSIISASRVFQHITMAEYAQPNRQAIHKWVRNDKDAIDWTPFMSFVADLEQKSLSEIEIRTRSAIKEVIMCDVDADKILTGHTRECYDFIITSAALVSACKSVEEYEIAVAKLCSYLKHGGGLVFIEILKKENFYHVGDYKFHDLPLTMETVKGAVEDANMNIKRMESIHFNEEDVHELKLGFDYLMMFATKKI